MFKDLQKTITEPGLGCDRAALQAFILASTLIASEIVDNQPFTPT